MIFIYLTLFALLFGILMRNKLEQKRYKRIYLFVCFFQFFFVYAFRALNVGADTEGYAMVYRLFDNSEYYGYLFTHYEIGFQFLYKILKMISNEPQILLVVSGIIINLGFSIFIYKNSENVVLSTVLYSCLLFPNSLNIMRQFIAMSIAINSLQFLKEDKTLKAICLILISTLFHSSALLYLFFVFAYKINNWKAVSILVLSSIALYIIFPTQIANFIFGLNSSFSYYSSSNFIAGRSIRMTSVITFLTLLLSMYSYYKRKDNKYTKEITLYTTIFSVNALFGVLYLNFEIFSRVIQMLNAYLLTSIPLFKVNSKGYYKPVISIAIYTIAFVILLTSISFSGSGTDSYAFFF